MFYRVEALRHAAETEEVRHIGQYDTLALAIDAAQRTIDEFLRRALETGTSPSLLFLTYQGLGEHPVIFVDSDKTLNVPDFNHFQYAFARCAYLTDQKNQE